MWMSDNWSEAKELKVRVDAATSYESRGGAYADYPDENTKWLKLNNGRHDVSLRLTLDQLESLHAQLGAHLQDLQRQAHPETCCDGSEVLQVGE